MATLAQPFVTPHVSEETAPSHWSEGRVTAEQLHAELPFQVADGLGQRRLRDAEALGCPSEVQLLGYRDEIAQLPGLQLTHISKVSMQSQTILVPGADPNVLNPSALPF